MRKDFFALFDTRTQFLCDLCTFWQIAAFGCQDAVSAADGKPAADVLIERLQEIPEFFGTGIPGRTLPDADGCPIRGNLQGAAAADACFFADIRRDDDAPLGIHVSYHGNTHKNRPFSYVGTEKEAGLPLPFLHGCIVFSMLRMGKAAAASAGVGPADLRASLSRLRSAAGQCSAPTRSHTHPPALRAGRDPCP